MTSCYTTSRDLTLARPARAHLVVLGTDLTVLPAERGAAVDTLPDRRVTTRAPQEATTKRAGAFDPHGHHQPLRRGMTGIVAHPNQRIPAGQTAGALLALPGR